MLYYTITFYQLSICVVNKNEDQQDSAMWKY